MPGAGEALEPGRVELAVGDARGHEHAARAQAPAAGERDLAPGAPDLEPDRALHAEQLGAEAARLHRGAVGEVRAAQAPGEPEVVLDAAGLPGLAAGRLALDHHGAQALGGAVDGGGEPSRAAADDDQVVVLGGGLARDAQALGQLEDRGALEHRAVLEQRHRQPAVVDAGHLQQLAALAVALDVHPPRRDAVAGQEVAQLVRLAREAVPDQAHAPGLQRGAAGPRRQQVLDDRVEVLLRRVPGLEQVVVERHLVDGLDRGLGVGVGGQQHALGARHDLTRLHEELGARQARHALIGHQQRHLVAAHHEVAQDVQALLPGARAQDPVALAELAAQVARHRREHGGLVVDREDRGAPPALAVVRVSHRRERY